ncbi:RNA polymerase sigma factor [Nannocystis pusilla]|uniref:RNA polymerase sigma factor n=1 Tax=Nannocystis pusilla TaxID=889268 RepID=UPI003DA6029A
MTKPTTSTIAALVNAHADALNRFFRSSGVPYADAQDLAQETLQTLLERDPATIEKPRAFLMGIARKKLLQFRTRTRTSEEFRSSQTPHAVTSPSQRMDRRLRVQILLQRLDEEERTAFLLRCEGLALEEIAEQMELSLATIKRRLAEARRHIEELTRQLEERDNPLSVEDVEDSYRRD